MTTLKSLFWDTNGIPFLIAEIGINHGGSSQVARQLIASAQNAGVQGIKFQYRNIENAYIPNTREIGDEIISSEVTRNYISPQDIVELTHEAKSLGLYVGCSFFHSKDCHDFKDDLMLFDFFKIPSVELLNFELTDFLISKQKPVLISTGAHYEYEIEMALNRLIDYDNWYPLHCVSNYPVAYHNSSLSYIAHLQNRWKIPVGLSSHERFWELILLAMKFKPRIIERHITMDKSVSGLDQSSSSSPEEFLRLSTILREMQRVEDTMIDERVPNHGEIINRQNLGRSYYFTTLQQVGMPLEKTTLKYRSPGVGLNSLEITKYESRKLTRVGEPNSPVTSSHFQDQIQLDDDEISAARDLELSLPVRLHDFLDISRQFPIGSFELHLSFKEVSQLSFFKVPSKNISLTVHLPDYIDSLNLIDPFSKDVSIADSSRKLIREVSDFVKSLQDTLGKPVFIIGSFSQRNLMFKKRFFEDYREYFNQFVKNDIQICLQWLPPFAWYFGGSMSIDVMNSPDDVSHIKELGIPICMDTSHVLMGANFFHFDPWTLIQDLSHNVKHLHISDARGVDGEGAHFDFSTKYKRDFFKQILSLPGKKVIEVWQGHLNNREGFALALKDLISLDRGLCDG